MPLLSLHDLQLDPAPYRYLSVTLPWVLDAGNPFLDWFFGPDEVRSVVARRMRRHSSELAIRRTVALGAQGEAVGGYIGMGGDVLRACRLADALGSLAGEHRASQGTPIRDKIIASSRLFPPVSGETFYLSKMGVLRPHRGRGFGRSLLQSFLDRGRSAGFGRFRLELAYTNETALGLYRSVGFEVVGDASLPGTDIRYLWMELRS